MKKLSYLVLALLLLNSCTEEDITGEPPFPIESFIGSWAYDTVTIDGETGFYPHRSECHKDHFMFRHNEGQWNMYTETIYSDANCANQTTNLEWQLAGDILKLNFGEQLVATYKILSVTTNTFSVLYNVDVDNDGRKDEVIINAVRYDPFGNFDN